MLLTYKSTKIDKGTKYGFMNVVLHLAPHREGGGRSVCPWSTPECRAHCLRTSGRMRLGTAPAARARRTALFWSDRKAFLAELHAEIAKADRQARRKGLSLVVRLNGTSDLPWEQIDPSLFFRHPAVTFYDYTKSGARMARYLAGQLPRNYTLCLSRSDAPGSDLLCREVLSRGGTVAVVFQRQIGLPSTWYGFPVVDGDRHDIRSVDAPGSVVGLVAKGTLRRARWSAFISPTRW